MDINMPELDLQFHRFDKQESDCLRIVKFNCERFRNNNIERLH